MGQLDGKVVLITGGGTGIGLGIAQLFAQEGALLCLTGRREEPLRSAAETIGGGTERVIWRAADVSDAGVMEQVVQACRAAFGRLDILVCNAGVTGGAEDVNQFDRYRWDQIMDTNLLGIMTASSASLPSLRESQGSVLVISSTSGLRAGGASSIAYAASKAGANMVAQGLARDLAPDRVRVNVICPGWIDTDMAQASFTRKYGERFREGMEAVGQQIPLGRFGRPADIAHAALYLSGQGAEWVTGAVLLVDGGGSVSREEPLVLDE
jgi:NAD(P)-dependent dehydrogenase (short-subunit alcohol dehydrogenase family)